MCGLMMIRSYSRQIVATVLVMVELGKRQVVLWKRKSILFALYFYLGLGNGSLWFHLGLTLNLISYNFLEVLSPRRSTFNFCQNKNIFNRYTEFLSNHTIYLMSKDCNLLKSVLKYLSIFKIKLVTGGILFLQETHSSNDTEKQ